MTAPVRAPDLLRQLATDLAVTANFAFLPHRRVIAIGGEQVTTGMLTLCNCYVSVFTAALGCPVPPFKAVEQLKWLTSNEGKMAGWFSGNRELAIERAALGYPTIAVAYATPHGHIAMVLPSLSTDPTGAYVSAAGAQNFVYTKLEASFGHLSAACQFFTHN